MLLPIRKQMSIIDNFKFRMVMSSNLSHYMAEWEFKDRFLHYFRRQSNQESVESSPEGTCPVCWGRNEWDGQFYEIMKDKHAKPGDDIYDSFISKIADEHVRTTHNLNNKYVCVTCDKEI
jgi:hypothetical protein